MKTLIVQYKFDLTGYYRQILPCLFSVGFTFHLCFSVQFSLIDFKIPAGIKRKHHIDPVLAFLFLEDRCLLRRGHDHDLFSVIDQLFERHLQTLHDFSYSGHRGIGFSPFDLSQRAFTHSGAFCQHIQTHIFGLTNSFEIQCYVFIQLCHTLTQTFRIKKAPDACLMLLLRSK